MRVASFGIIVPYFFEENNKTVRVNTERLVNIIENFVIPKLKKMKNCSFLWFQQDGAIPHTAKKTMAVLKRAFRNRIIFIYSGNDIQWPPRSPDLSICDFFV